MDICASPISDGSHYLALVLDNNCKEKIQSIFTKRFPVVKCDHVTIAYPVLLKDREVLRNFLSGAPSFYIDCFIQSDGIDLFRVNANGKGARPIEGIFHLTYTRTEERASSDSNKVLSGDIPIERFVYVSLALTGELKLIKIE